VLFLQNLSGLALLPSLSVVIKKFEAFLIQTLCMQSVCFWKSVESFFVLFNSDILCWFALPWVCFCHLCWTCKWALSVHTISSWNILWNYLFEFLHFHLINFHIIPTFLAVCFCCQLCMEYPSPKTLCFTDPSELVFLLCGRVDFAVMGRWSEWLTL